MIPVALTIAGSDPSGGAGLQADLKTFHRFGVYGEAVVTLITVQNTRGVTRVSTLDPELVAAQIRAVLEDIPPQAAKVGALGSREIVEAVAREAGHFSFPLIVDPVMISKHGARLLDEAASRALMEQLLPRTFLLTPNLDEAAALTGLVVEDRDGMARAAQKLASFGAANVLIKGGHLSGDALDLLYFNGGEIREFTAPRIETRHTHGLGCTYSAAIAAELAKGTRLVDAVARAKLFITGALRNAPGLGAGNGPLNHHA
ncbi:MAG: bifunctional hydroxymethylpyrimidine kinase/phosphomethylpyrimidine kinase [Acidobacteriota bacterium]|nr:bifunctional hydroxymethylpyrimidine kinase/phosphomethylpyrimidine kinase [Acidobacteriota bacterium]